MDRGGFKRIWLKHIATLDMAGVESALEEIKKSKETDNMLWVRNRLLEKYRSLAGKLCPDCMGTGKQVMSDCWKCNGKGML